MATRRVIGLFAPLAFVLLAGYLVGFAAFGATSTTLQRFGHSNPPCPGLVVVEAAYDPLTGAVRGTEFTCPVSATWPTGWHLLSSVPDELAGHRAIPVPVGFVVGAVAGMAALWLVRTVRGPRGA